MSWDDRGGQQVQCGCSGHRAVGLHERMQGLGGSQRGMRERAESENGETLPPPTHQPTFSISLGVGRTSSWLPVTVWHQASTTNPRA